MNTRDILADLIAFDTTSRNPNADLMAYIRGLLTDAGIASTLIPIADGTKANLYATIGPPDAPGVMLSGHTDVVPIDGQNWTKPAFKLTEADGKLFGRGTTDMKGFVASALATAIRAAKRQLTTPLHLAFSYDEEIGCIGVRSLLDMLDAAPIKPAMCIVGEPTSMAVATGHKGKIAMTAHCIGREGHSALAPFTMNAIHLAADFVSILRDVQNDLMVNGRQDGDYDVPYTTVHAGKINGGIALNIVPNLCDVSFEIRNIAEDNVQDILDTIKTKAVELVAAVADHAPEADIQFEDGFSYPGLSTPTDAAVVNFVKLLTGANGTIKVAFGTEGGLFNGILGIPTVVCGPGSMAQGHKPDEFISVEQLNRCDAMMDSLLDQLESGI